MYPSPFPFPAIQSPVLPDPSQFFSPQLVSSPLPTDSFFQNFVLKNGDQPEYFHPYLVQSSNNSLSFCYPLIFSTLAVIYQAFSPDITISSANSSGSKHVITAYDDLSVTLLLPPAFTAYLVRGSPFVTLTVKKPTNIFVSTVQSFVSVSSNPSFTKHTIILSNNQTWLCYSSSPVYLQYSKSRLTSNRFSGVLRFAVLPSSNSINPTLLDQFSSTYPVSGTAKLAGSYMVEYRWKKKGSGDLLLLAHPLHLQLLSREDRNITIFDNFKYTSLDGDLVGVVAETWVLKTDPISINWYSSRGIDEDSFPEIRKAVSEDVHNLTSKAIGTNSSYFYGKAIARAARLALIAEEVRFPEVIPAVRKFLTDSITPWLDGTFAGDSFLYDPKWGGLVTSQGSVDSTGDFGFGIYNDHHYHLGYFLYAIAVLAKLDPGWGWKYHPQAYALASDFLTPGRRRNPYYTKLRMFDLWRLHSWASGLTEFADGRNQESTSEAVNAYYAAALMGVSYGDRSMSATAATLLAVEIRAAAMWWHVKEGSTMYKEFGNANRVVGILWSKKRDSALWFAPAEWREIRLGIQVLPLTPITEALFGDVGYAKELVEWSLPALKRPGATDGWRGFVYALEALYEKGNATGKIRKLEDFDDGNSLSNLLWWVHSRESEGNKTKK